MTKHFITLSIFFLVTSILFSQESEWNNPSISRVNEEQPRSYFIHFPTEQLAAQGDPTKSPWVMVLGGNWQYKLVSKPKLRPVEFPLPTFDASSWERISIPEKDEAKRNIDTIRSFSKTNNPVASYLKVFPVPEDWYNSQLFVRFDGVSQACYVWLNGKRVGYTESGMHGAEFNISPYVTYGRMNTLAIQVYGWCDGSAVEKTDSIWGLYSNVSIIAVPKFSIRDFAISTSIENDNKTGMLLVSIFMKKYNPEIKDKYKLILSLKDDKNKDLFTPLVSSLSASKKSDSLFVFKQVVPKIKPWQANDPNLYTMVVTMRDKDNKIVDAIGSKIGFRNVSKTQNEISVNSNVVNTDSMAVLQSFRTLHAMDICNKQGIYLTDKLVQPNNNNTSELLYRARKHFERDKNQVSIIRWNIGKKEDSESFDAINNWLLQIDKMRVVE